MRPAGYTLIELLVVISIISIMTVVGFVNFKDFSSDQITVKAIGQIQSVLRVAQSNATSSVLCGSNGGASWSVIIDNASPSTLTLACGSANSTQRVYALENAQIIQILGAGCGGLGAPITFTYSSGMGALRVSPTNSCWDQAPSIVFTLRNMKNNTNKTFSVSKGGATNVQ